MKRIRLLEGGGGIFIEIRIRRRRRYFWKRDKRAEREGES